MSTLYSIWNFIGHYKYVITILFFTVVILFVGEDCVWARRERRKEIDRLRMEKAKYQKRFDEDTRIIENMDNSLSTVEKIARERYHMKRGNEDVFLFVGLEPESDSLE